MLHRFDIWLFGCYCNGPCNHTHGWFQEWFWNTKHLCPFVSRIFLWLTNREPWEG
jgi:hypothetical protein